MNKLLFILLFVVSNSCIAQDDEISKIRALYQKTTEEQLIAVMPAPDNYGTLYNNEIVINKYNGSWRAVGNYICKMNFWYTDQPAFAKEEHGKEESALRKVEMTSTWSANNIESFEFLYENGELVFCLKKDATYDNQEKPLEYRYYFSRGKLIRYMLGQETQKTLPDTKEVLANSQRMMNLFLTTFKY
ncbi:MAG: hypothetical protein V2A54_06360 [Bacteroidota bacterium]